MGKLTVNQVLQQAVNAHKAGRSQEAHRLYTAILKVQPKHPDANHNTGLLTVGFGKIELALPFFKTALEANPNNVQFWYSHIVALIKLERLTDAKALLDKAKSKGIKGADFDQLEQRLNNTNKALFIKPNNADNYYNMGIALQNQSKLEEAIEAYNRALSIKPDYAEAYYNMGIALQNQSKLEEAIEVYNKVLSIKPNYVDAYFNMGNALKKQGKLEEAIEAYNKVLSIKPDYAEAYYNMGDVLKKQGKLEEVIEVYNKVLSIKPDYVDAYFNMGIALQNQSKLEEAIEAYNKALSIKPDYAEAYYNIGIVLQEQGKLEEAIEAYNKTLSIRPNYVDAYNNMGNALKKQGKLEEAIETYNKVLSIKPDYVDAYFNMGNVLQDQGKPEEAIEIYNKALAIKPDYAKAYYNIGIVLQEQGKLEEAIETYNKVLSIKPDYVEAYNNIGNALVDQGKPEEAIDAYKKAISIKPDYAQAHHNLSFALLAVKDFDQGFIESEWRWKSKRQDGTFLKSTKPMWNGEKNQRVLVWGEQGIGDEILFSSIIPELYTTSLKILVKCDKRLIPLFKRSFPVDIIYFSKDKPVPEDEYDFHIPMGSLPLTFRKSLDSFKKSALGYLKPDTARAKSIRGQLIHEQGKKLIGISWKTASPTKGSSYRNINLAELARALDSSNTQLVCLQYGDVSNEIEAVKRDFNIEVIQFSDVDNKHDIDGLAALMAACDTVVTIANVTTHLSGALGLPTKLMLPLTVNWRWGASENSSYWYDSVRLYKQSEFNDWYSVLARI